jgi:5'-3' exonuclease
MGIKGFRSWFESAFPSSVTKVQHPSPERKAPKKQRGGGKIVSSSISNVNRSTQQQQQQIETQPETYDHVLIDANQFLHSNLRKAFNRKLKRSKGNAQFDGQNLDEDFIEYSLLLLIQDLNRLTSTVAIPRKSLVIAIDGSPGAAKLEMQRRRRYGLYKKVELQQKLLEVLRERGWTDSHFGYNEHNAWDGLFGSCHGGIVVLGLEECC